MDRPAGAGSGTRSFYHEEHVQKRTAAATIVLAARDLDITKGEFSEWDLTIQAWSIDRQTFGMRGYEHHHPDHKRVYMEICGAKPGSPVRVGLIKRTRTSHYRITDLGIAAAAWLDTSDEEVRELHDFSTFVDCVDKSESYAQWLNDPSRPDSPSIVIREFGEIRKCKDRAEEIVKLCSQRKITYFPVTKIHRGKYQLTGFAPMSVLASMVDFYHAMDLRFPLVQEPAPHSEAHV